MQPIPFIRVSGDHYEAGRQIGAACRDALARSLSQSRAAPPSGKSWEDLRRAAAPYLAATSASLPWVVEELRGAAEGAAIDLLDLAVLGTEEIWGEDEAAQGCSDFAAGPPATADGQVWLAHNNDLSPSVADQLFAVEWRVKGQPALFTLGVGGIFISVGYNSAGLSLTGNELSPNDERIGVPRLLIVRDILAQRTAAAAIQAATNPARASSYNNLVAHKDGTIVNVEGSGGDHALLPAEDGWTVHTNHYVAPSMLRYEADPSDIAGSAARYQRARELLAGCPRPVTPARLRGFLADQVGAPDCLCKDNESVQTVFWCVIGLHQGTIEYGRDPREVESQRFGFEIGD
jgi:isopenicillin-N N-acyltransferase like protein